LRSAKVAFKSKVVSRAHAEIWCEAGGKVSSAQRLIWVRFADAGWSVLCERYKVIFRHILEPYSALESEYRVPTVSH
jgi:hypothetical protein